ncbi:MAG: ABC transporter ATP-binding protein [Chloroflexi bacterium]|nr:ABC transporter ATP-binding protein [Chloroflexota bacterium]
MTTTQTNNAPLMEVENLSVTFFTPAGAVRAVRDVSLQVQRNEVLGIVGESGCGKSTVGYAMMGYLPGTTRLGGSIRFEGQDITNISATELRKLRGNTIGMVYQDPTTSLNPVMRVGPQVEEVLRQHTRLSREQARNRTAELFESVGLAGPRRIGRRYPHELSGGQQQRGLIAMALACDPHLLIMDEPTTGLDVTTEATILDLILDLKDRVNAGIILITHNLGVVARGADRVAVMYAGHVVEQGPVRTIFKNPRHPYTAGLISCVPQPVTHEGEDHVLRNIPGSVYSAQEETKDACLFASRCPMATAQCTASAPPVVDAGDGHLSKCFYWEQVNSDVWSAAETTQSQAKDPNAAPILTVKGLHHFYGTPRRRFVFFGPIVGRPVRAVVNVDLAVKPGQTLGVVGESGSGKTTLARNVVGLIHRTSGDIKLQGEDLGPGVEDRAKGQRSAIRMVFQNPTSSLNPKLPVSHALMRPLKKFQGLKGPEARERAAALLQAVGLEPGHLDRLPGELSGGQQQRVALAATFAGKADLIVADEAVSALDVSVQAQVLNLLKQHQQEAGTSYIFISHDLGVVRYVSDDILVMYAGHVAESGPRNSVLRPPSHPYTEALLSAAPAPDPDAVPTRIRLPGTVPTLRQAFTGCFFAGRCPRKVGDICDTTPPPAQQGPDAPSHVIYCHIPAEQLKELQLQRSNGKQDEVSISA